MPSSAPLKLSSATPCAGSDAGSGDRSTAPKNGLGRGPSVAARLLLGALRGYQVLLSPVFAGSCRYTPSCSNYMAEAVRRFGAARGGWLGLRRLLRCHPFGGHGLDPVPDALRPRRGAPAMVLGTLSGRPGTKVR